MLVAELAVLLHFQLAGLILLVLRDGIIPPLAFLTCQQYDLAHIPFLGLMTNCYKNCSNPAVNQLFIIGITPCGFGNCELRHQSTQ